MSNTESLSEWIVKRGLDTIDAENKRLDDEVAAIPAESLHLYEIRYVKHADGHTGKGLVTLKDEPASPCDCKVCQGQVAEISFAMLLGNGEMSDTLTCEDYYPDTDAKGETDKHRHLVKEYTRGNGVDLGSAGCPVVPWAIQVDLPQEQYHIYNQTRPQADIHWRGSALDLPFKDQTLDFVHSSHLIEDFFDWIPVLKEWDRVLKPDGYMIISVPDHQRFRAYVQRGKDEGIEKDNLGHRHESYVGELTSIFRAYFAYEVLMDQFVNEDENEYSIIFVGRKIV